MIDHDDACSVVIDGQCNCKGGKIRTHVHALVQGHRRLYCIVETCDYEVPLVPREEGKADGNG